MREVSAAIIAASAPDSNGLFADVSPFRRLGRDPISYAKTTACARL